MDVDMYRGKVLVPSLTLKMLKGKGRGLFMHSLPSPPLEISLFRPLEILMVMLEFLVSKIF